MVDSISDIIALWVGNTGLYSLFSGIAVATSLFTLTRNPPNTLRQMAQEALERSTATQTSNEAFKADVTAILGAVQDERERALKAQARSRSAQQRAESGNAAPKSREEALSDLRRQAGLI